MQPKAKHPSSWVYPLKVWLWTMIAAPLVFVAALALVRSATWGELRHSLRIIPMLIVFGCLLLLPLLLLYWLFFWLLWRRRLSVVVKRSVLGSVGMLSVWLLYFFFDPAFFSEGGFGVYSWPLSYSVVLLTAGSLVRMPDNCSARAAKTNNKTQQNKALP